MNRQWGLSIYGLPGDGTTLHNMTLDDDDHVCAGQRNCPRPARRPTAVHRGPSPRHRTVGIVREQGSA